MEGGGEHTAALFLAREKLAQDRYLAPDAVEDIGRHQGAVEFGNIPFEIKHALEGNAHGRTESSAVMDARQLVFVGKGSGEFFEGDAFFSLHLIPDPGQGGESQHAGEDRRLDDIVVGNFQTSGKGLR